MAGVSSITRTRPRDQKKRRALGTRMTQLSLALIYQSMECVYQTLKSQGLKITKDEGRALLLSFAHSVVRKYVGVRGLQSQRREFRSVDTVAAPGRSYSTHYYMAWLLGSNYSQ